MTDHHCPVKRAWQTTRNTIREKNKFMFNNSLISDITFVIKSCKGEKTTIPAHKYVLAISSPVFFSMFYGEMAEQASVIDLPDCNSENFLQFLRFIYSDELDLTGSSVLPLFYLAKKYDVPCLGEKCAQFLEDNLDSNTVFCVLPNALKFAESRLVRRCWDIVYTQTELAVKSDPFLDIDRTLLQSFVERELVSLPEIEIFKAVDKWAENECRRNGKDPVGSEKRKILGEKIMHQIRFPLLREKDFAEYVLQSDLLTKGEVYDLVRLYNAIPGASSSFPGLPRLGSSKLSIKRCKRFPAVNHPNMWWARPQNSVEFSVSAPIAVYGVRLYGRESSSYKVILKCFEKSNLKSTLQEVADEFDCDSTETDGYYGFDVYFSTSVRLENRASYVLEAVIDGPSSHFGRRGNTEVISEGIKFIFFEETEKRSFGSRVESGQFAEILFHELI